jgi:probable F420-dependent oxidoreductase
VKVRIGVSFGVDGDTEAEAFAAAAVATEELGFDSLWLAERMSTPTPDPVAGLAFAAAHTRRLKLGTGVVVLPGRNPAVVAKQLATLDRLSGGRLLVTFGLGTPEPAEQAAFPVPPDRRRGEVFDEALVLVRRYLHEDDVDGVTVRPRPVQQPLELWVAGSARAAMVRAGRLSDGWLTSLLTPDEARQGRETVQAEAERAGRHVDPEHFGVSLAYAEGEVPPTLAATIARRRPEADPGALVPLGLPAAAGMLERFIAAGFSKFVVRPAATPDDWPETLKAMADALLPLQA